MSKKTIESVINSGNHIIVQVKNNQPTLLQECERFSDTKEADTKLTLPLEKCHGRIEERTILVFKGFMVAEPGWSLIKALIVMHRTRQSFSTKEKKWHVAHEKSFYISTVCLSAYEYMQGIRAHWGVENQNHYVKDVSMLEDNSRIRINPENFSRLRSWALSILRINQVHNISKTLYANALNCLSALQYYGVQ